MKLQSLPTGTELVADFRVERVLGAGGFGITYLAEEPALARKVTIKEYFPNEFAHRDENNEAVPRSRNCAEDYKWGLDRFIEEAQTLARFDHRNIVRVYRYFRANNTAYMVLHFEEGKSLKGWLQSLGRAPRQNELDRIVAPLLEALSVIHAADFLHRDIAPDNIIIRRDGSPVLIDFGSARGEIAQHTRTVSALVKPGYSPYEQYSEIGKQQGPWTDIYALAATLYHAITGKRPPDAPSRIVKDERKSAREAAIGAYRPGFLDAIDRGLAIEIEKRPQSIAAWRGALLAPDPEPKSWFSRPAGPATSGTADDADVAKTRPLTNNPPLDAVPPPPDAPGRKGRLVDYIEGLKGSQQSEASPAAPASAKADEPEDATRRARPSRTRQVMQPPGAETAGGRPQKRGLAGLFARSERSPPSEAKPATTSDNVAMAATAAAAQAEPVQRPPAGALTPLPATPLRPVGRRRAPKPRAIRSGKKHWWRPLAFKLMIGLGIASLAVAYQQRMPQIELRSLGMVSSSARTFDPPSDEIRRQSSLQVAERPTPKPAPSLLIRRFKAHMPGGTRARFARSGQWIATTGVDGTLLLWDTASGARIRTIEMDDGPATALSISGDRALTGHSEGTVALWDLSTGTRLGAFKHSDVRIWSVAFDAGNERIFAASHDWSVAVWEVGTPSSPLHVFKGHENAVQAVAYSPKANALVSGSADRTVQLWNMRSLSKVRSYPRERDFITAIEFSGDGRYVAAGLLNGRISLLSARSRRRLRSFSGHDDAVTRLTYLKDGQHLMTFSRDGTARLWSVNRSRPLRTYGSSGTQLHDGDVSPDGGRLVTADSQGQITVWRTGRIETRPQPQRH